MEKAFTGLQEKELVKLYCDGVPTSELVKQFEVSDTTIRNVLRLHGVTPGNHHKRLGVEVEDRVVELYRFGSSVRQVAKEVGVVNSTVLKVLRRRGIERRPSGKQFKLSREDRLHAAMVYAEGLTLREIAKEFQISTFTVKSCLKEFGIPSRTGWGKFKAPLWTDRKGREFVFKSRWELQYAGHLDDLGLDWEYEPVKFVFDGYIYTPDFQVQGEKLEYHEVKGWLDDRAMDRMFSFVRQYPDVVFKLIGPAEMVKLGLVERYYENHPMAGIVIDFQKRVAQGG